MSQLTTMYPAQTNSPYTTTLGEISATDTAVVVADASVLPSQLPYLLTLGYDKSASETVLVTAVSGNTLTITRGVDGNALLWVAGTKAARVFTAKDLNDAQSNLRLLNEEKQEKLVSFSITLSSDGWSGSTPSQAVSDERVLLGGYDYIVTPAVGSRDEYMSAGVYAKEPTSAGKLTFACEIIPAADLTVHILRVDKGAAL